MLVLFDKLSTGTKPHSRSEVVKIQLKIANALPLYSITKYPLSELRFWYFQAGDQRNTPK